LKENRSRAISRSSPPVLSGDIQLRHPEELYAWDGITEWIVELPNKPQSHKMGAGNIVEYARTLLKGTAGEDDRSVETIDTE
jgi:hypothetical protein